MNDPFEKFDHPCKQTCSGWQQGYDKAKNDCLSEVAVALKMIAESEEKVQMCVETMNAVQNKIGIWARGSHSLGKDINDAWNLNASALSSLGKEQNEYLSLSKKLKEAVELIRKRTTANLGVTEAMDWIEEYDRK